MKDLSYKSYTGSAEMSIEDNCLHGRILFITDSITYEGSTVQELVSNFEETVDDYLAYCQETNQEPNKPFSGSFNVRTGAGLHKKAAEKAREQGKSLNEFVVSAISDAANETSIAVANKVIDFMSSSTQFSADKQKAQSVWS